MSGGYAAKLSFREDLGGQLGAPELFDSPDEVDAKAERLAELIRQARRIIVFTGAGISTSCGIMDFRGPRGLWTLQRAGLPLPEPKVTFAHAKPSLTHQVLVALMRSGKLTYLVSQNVDGLHLRSGIPRANLAELHGNCFAERCQTCGTEFIRDFEVETVGFRLTGRKCSQPGCGAALRDHILDWEDALPPDELELSEHHAREADLAICLGTSLQITPACNLPLKTTRTYKAGTKQQPGQLVIINLQRTQHDNKAIKSGGLVCHARCDDVMRLLVRKLDLLVPPYVRHDAVVVGHQQHGRSSVGLAATDGVSSSWGPTGEMAEKEAVQGGGDAPSSSGTGDSASSSAGIAFSVFVQSSHGPKCPMPIVQSVDVVFQDPQLKPATLTALPFVVRRTARRPGPLHVSLTLHLHEAADEDKRTVLLKYMADLQPGLSSKASLQQQQHEFITQMVHYGVHSATIGQQEAAAEAKEPDAAAAGLAMKEPVAAGVQQPEAATLQRHAGAVPTGASHQGIPQQQQQQLKRQRVE